MPVFDIETGPRIDVDLESLIDPFTEQYPGEFFESQVKLGNVKDPAKIAEKIEAAREKHRQEIAAFEQSKSTHVANAISKAALSPRTGCVLAIGLKSSKGATCIHVDDCEQTPEAIQAEEASLLAAWWAKCSEWKRDGRKIIGHHISFDLPFLVRRSWILGVPVPGWLFASRYRPDCFVDTEERWLCFGRFGSEKSNLDFCCSAFGIEGKYKPEPMQLPGDEFPSQLGGDTFHRFFRAGGDFREQALSYLVRDIEATYQLAVRMGLDVD